MLLIYFHENPDQIAQAKEIAGYLRMQGIACGLRNASVFNALNFERVEAVLCLECPEVAELYETRNADIERAKHIREYTTEDAINEYQRAQFADTPVAEVFTSAEQLMQALEPPEEQPAYTPPDYPAMTVAQLLAIINDRELVYPTNYKKADLVNVLKAADEAA